jgi:hypothetical protein
VVYNLWLNALSTPFFVLGKQFAQGTARLAQLMEKI